jgi:hypothetical protein
VQVLLALGFMALAVRQLAVNWSTFRSQPVEWQFTPGWLVLSAAVVLAMYGILIDAWRTVLAVLDRWLPFLPAARIWMLASLGKYVPGKVWAVAGTAVLSQQAGVNPRAAVVSALILQALALGSGLAIVGVTAPHALALGGRAVVWGAALLALAAAAALIVLSWSTALGVVRRYLPGSWRGIPAVPPLVMFQAFLSNCVAWVGYGAALLFLDWGLFSERNLTLLQAIGVFASGYLVGIVAFFAPGGLGARESVLLLLLVEPLGAPTALALTVASRLLLTATEIGGAVPFLLAGRSRPAPH